MSCRFESNSCTEDSLRQCLKFFDVHLVSPSNTDRSSEEKILNEIVDMCHRYKIKEKEFVNSWMAYALNNQIDILDSATLIKFEFDVLQKQIQKFDGHQLSQKENQLASPQREYIEQNTFSSNNDDSILSLYNSPDLSKRKNQNRFLTPYRKLIPENDIMELNSPIESGKKKSNNIICEYINIHGMSEENFLHHIELSKNKKHLFKNIFKIIKPFDSDDYFNEPQRDLNRLMNKRISSYKKSFPNMIFSDISEIFHTPQYYAGYFLRLKKTAEKDKTSNFIFIGCEEISRNSHVQCDFSSLESFSIFSGMVSVIKGTNPSGQSIRVEEIIPIPNMIQTRNFYDTTSSSYSVDFLVINGPILQDNSENSFEYANKIFDHIKKNKIKLCIIIGHPLSNENYVDKNLSDEVIEQDLHYIDNFALQNNMHFVVIPTLDHLHFIQIYPQGLPSSSSLFHLTKNLSNIHFLSNPVQFNYLGINFICNTIDALLDIGSNDLAKNRPMHRIDSLIQQIMNQRFVYPVISENERNPIDYKLLGSIGYFDDIVPQIFIQKSNLKHFIKESNGSFFINMGKLHSYSTKNSTDTPIVGRFKYHLDLSDNQNSFIGSIHRI